MEAWLAEKLPAMGVEMPKNKREIVLLDDALRNLEPAHTRGWTTVFVNPSFDSAPYVDYHIPHLMDLADLKI
jgi:putative hydrolase of the HAD superfamily